MRDRRVYPGRSTMRCQILDTRAPSRGVPGFAAFPPATHPSMSAARPWSFAAVPTTKECRSLSSVTNFGVLVMILKFYGNF